jgi:hypothetical protein
MAINMDAWLSEYHAEIRSLAEEYGKQPEDTREDWLHETIDGHEWIIYTWQARCVLVATDNPDAYEGEMGEKPGTVEQAAYMAMCVDVREAA